MIFRKKTFVSFVYVMTSATLFSGTAFAESSGANRKINSLNSVTVKSSPKSSYRFDHTNTGFDIHGGLSVANMSGSAVSQSGYSLDNNLGLAAGIGYDCELSSNFAARPELNFVQKGFAMTPMDGVKASLNMYYIEMPLLLKASTDAGGFRPNLVAGPAVAVNVGNSIEAHSTDNNTSVRVNQSDVGAKKLDYGLQFGGGVEIATENHNAITADFRYDMGLVNINKDSGELKNRALLFMMGFKF